MKMSISLPDAVGYEIKNIAEKTDRNISWWIRRAWELSRDKLLSGESEEKARRQAMKFLYGLHGVLKNDFPGETSVSLSKKAFLLKKR